MGIWPIMAEQVAILLYFLSYYGRTLAKTGKADDHPLGSRNSCDAPPASVDWLGGTGMPDHKQPDRSGIASSDYGDTRV
jgi:hypothetical protein